MVTIKLFEKKIILVKNNPSVFDMLSKKLISETQFTT